VLGDLFYDDGFAVIGPYMAKVWPADLRGMGSAYGFGGIGKIIGPPALPLIVGSSNVVKRDVTVVAIPSASCSSQPGSCYAGWRSWCSASNCAIARWQHWMQMNTTGTRPTPVAARAGVHK
jgi:hypothetical protein